MNKYMSVLIVILFIFILAGCAIKEVEPEAKLDIEEIEVTPTPTEEATPLTPNTPVYEHTALLTGLPIEVANTNRPIAVLINNLKPARPQSGLQEADIVWEVLAEGGITRLIAIFQSTEHDDVTIGPVRSNRPYFIEIADSYNAVIAHAGASTDAYAILQKQKKPYLDEISNAGPAYWRSSERKAPHNLYTNLKNLREQMDKKKYTAEANVKGYAYAASETDVANVTKDAGLTSSANSANETDANQLGSVQKLDVQFQLSSYKVSYELDMENKQYIRLVNNEQHMDKDTSTSLAAKNLVFMQTKHTVLDSEGRLEVDLKSGGDAIVIADGHVKEAKWIKADDGMIRFTISGEEVQFMPGKTFIHVLPTGKSIYEHVKF